MTTEKAQGWLKLAIPLGIALVVILLVTKIFKIVKTGQAAAGKVTDALGITEKDEYKPDIKKAASNIEYFKSLAVEDDPFSPQYFKSRQDKYILSFTKSSTELDETARLIKLGIGNIWDNPEDIEGVIKRDIGTKVTLSSLAERFQIKHNQDLFSFLVMKLDTAEQKVYLNKILEHVMKLPTGIGRKYTIQELGIKKTIKGTPLSIAMKVAGISVPGASAVLDDLNALNKVKDELIKKQVREGVSPDVGMTKVAVVAAGKKAAAAKKAAAKKKPAPKKKSPPKKK